MSTDYFGGMERGFKKLHAATENNNMDLTQEELRYAEKYIRRLEKDARQWKWTRGMLLFGAGVFAVSSAYFFNEYFALLDVLSDIRTVLKSPITPDMVEVYVAGVATQLRNENALLWNIWYTGIFGGAWLVFSIANWNRHLKSAITAKLLRKALSDASPPHASGGPTAGTVAQ